MTVAVMQPYIFPYLGYYQLAKVADVFIFFDDVNFINKGWINRNRILQQNEPFKFTIPLNKASQNKLINEIEISDYDKWRQDFCKLIEYNYRKAPEFVFVSSWLKDFLYAKDYRLVSELTADSVSKLAALFDLETTFLFSGELNYKDENTNGGQEKILRICEMQGASRYVNPKNGMDIYDETKFQARNIDLKFIIMDDIRYKQFAGNAFAESLSILDVLMFNDLKAVKQLLDRYTLTNKIVI